MVSSVALGASPQSAVLVTDLNWQVEHALLYYTRWQRRDVPWVRLPDVQLHFPFLARDNEAISRDLLLDSYSARDVVAAFGPLFPLQRDAISASPERRWACDSLLYQAAGYLTVMALSMV